MGRIVFVLAIAVMVQGCDKDDPPAPAGITLDKIPGCGTSSNLHGRVGGVDASSHRVLVYIRVCGAWWGAKPYWASPLTSIGSGGQFEVDVTTGGRDSRASEYAIYVVDEDFDPPALRGSGSVPTTVDAASVYDERVSRSCGCF